MSNRVFAFVAALSLTGCAATGSSFSERMALADTPATNTSRLIVYRTGASIQYSARSARITLDNTELGNVDNKGFNIFDVGAGSHTLAADMWDAPGKCELLIQVEPTQEYYFEVAARTGSLVSGLLGGIAGMAIESSGKACGGAFMITPTSKDVAIPALTPLRLTQ